MPFPTFPLLKLPYLCIECVFKNAEVSDIVFFALISKKSRQIVKTLKIHLNRVQIFLAKYKWITLGCATKTWEFRHGKEECGNSLVLQKDARPLYARRNNQSLHSYTTGNKVTALTMALEHLQELFECSIEEVYIDVREIPKSGKIGVSSTVDVHITGQQTVDNQILKSFLNNLEVLGNCELEIPIPEDFSYDPKLFNCYYLQFSNEKSADWITKEVLLQFDVPQLYFYYHRFSVDDIVSFITQWFNSESRTLDLLYLRFKDAVTLDNFQIQDLNPMPFSEERRSRRAGKVPFMWEDLSTGLDIIRSDGLLATLWVDVQANPQ
ncbi:unnamed protein product [Caenorhabditis brenneri]